MAPELQILAINASGLLVAYLLIYPALGPLTNTAATLWRLARADMIVLSVLLATSGALFWGSGTLFSLFLFETNWFWFALLTLIGLEVPLYIWFLRRHGLSLDALDADDP